MVCRSYRPALFISIMLFQATSLPALSQEKQIFDGLTYRHLNAQEPYNISLHLLEVDPTKTSISLQAALNKCVGKEKISTLAKNHDGLAAINGGYSSSSGIPSHHLKIDSQWFSATQHKRAAIGWNRDGSNVMIDTIKTIWSLKTPDQSFPINSLNQTYSPARCTLYSSCYDQKVAVNEKSTVITIVNNVIATIQTGVSTLPIPHNGYVYVVGHEVPLATGMLKPSMPATIETTITCSNKQQNKSWDNIDYLINGTPLLIKDGKKITHFASEHILESFVLTQHPRTAVGILPNGHWLLVVIDARNGHYGIGVTLHELADIMLELGCIDALNLAGGRSSTMYVNGKVVTQANAAHSFVLDLFDVGVQLGEKRVSDALIISRKKNV